MAKPAIKPNPRTQQVLEDLEQFREFVVDFGYRFNEADLYNFKSYAWQQYSKFTSGKSAKNMWDEDTRRFAGYTGYRPA
jgi:hypothetical protein